MKSFLQDFSRQYPHEKNPANVYTLLTEDVNNNITNNNNMSVINNYKDDKSNDNNDNNNDKDDVNALKLRQEQLERMVNALVSRLEK